MNHIFLILGGMILAFIAVTLYACLVVAGRADRQMEQLMEAEALKAEDLKRE